MKKKDIQELKHRPTVELEHVVKESQETLRKLRFDLAAGKVKDISGINELKKKVARIKTFIHERAKQGK
ncbi:MAG: 50S ribosomal protein L29 [Minisyncoccia bacterium]|jgi:large subunit ribosomal protein L29